MFGETEDEIRTFQRTSQRNRERRNEPPFIIISSERTDIGGAEGVCVLNKLQSTTKSQKSQEQYVLMMQTSANR